MELILTEDVPALGQAGEIVKVKAGYGRNYLLPQGLAMLATRERVKDLEHKRRVIEERQKKTILSQQGVAKELVRVKLAFDMQSNEEGKLFGSVTNQDIHAQIRESGFEVDRRKIQLAEPIKAVGEYTVKIALHREVIVELPVSVTSSQVIAASEPDEPEPMHDFDDDDEPRAAAAADDDEDGAPESED